MLSTPLVRDLRTAQHELETKAAAIGELLSSNGNHRTHRRRITAEGRAAISAAQKTRWARTRRKAKA